MGVNSPPPAAGQPGTALGRELRRLRRRAGLARTELARRAGVSATRIGEVERGLDSRGIQPRPRPETLRRLARGLAAPPGHGAVAEDLYQRLMVAAGYGQLARRSGGPRTAAGGACALRALAPGERAAMVLTLRTLADALAAIDEETPAD